MKFIKIEKTMIQANLTILTLEYFLRILTNRWISLICHHGTSKSKKYAVMVQVPSVFQGGVPDHQLEFRDRITTVWKETISKLF